LKIQKEWLGKKKKSSLLSMLRIIRAAKRGQGWESEAKVGQGLRDWLGA